jgi:hypothetical protein
LKGIAVFVIQNVKFIVKKGDFIVKKLIYSQKHLNFEAKKECSPLFLYIALKSDLKPNVKDKIFSYILVRVVGTGLPLL